MTISPARVSALRLMLRRARADARSLVLLALLTGLVALAAGVVPRAMAATSAADLAVSVSSVSTPTRDPSAVLTTLPATAIWPEPTHESVYGILDASIARIQDAADEPLRSAMGEAQEAVITKDAIGVIHPDLARSPGDLALRLAADPADSADSAGSGRVVYIAGAAPVSWVYPARAATAEDAGGPAEGLGALPDFAATATSAHPFEFALAKDAAAAMKLTVGDEVTGSLGVMRLSGIFEQTDPDDGYWQHVTGVTDAEITYPGNDSPLFTATALVNPLSVGTFLMSGELGVYTRFWWPLSAASVTPANAAEMSSALHRFGQTLFPLSVPDGSAVRSVTVSSSLADAIDTSRGRMSATLAVLSLCLAGPVGAVLAVFALAARSVALRRSAVTALMVARGARARDLRVVAGAEGLAVGVPVGVVAEVVAAAVVPGGYGAGGEGGDCGGILPWALPLVVALSPAAFFAVTAVDGRGLRLARRDLSPLARGRVRLALEIGAIVLAGLATLLLVRRGVASAAAFDPLLTLAPLLLALAVSVVALRLLPVLLGAAARIARRGRGIVAFIGTARATREPALGVAAVLALVLGVAVAVFASATLTTVDRTARAAAHNAVGADVRATGALFSDAAVDAVAAVPGVASVVPLATAGASRLAALSNGVTGGAGSGASVTVLITDTAALRAQHPDVPVGLSERIDGRIPMLVSRDLADIESTFGGQATGAHARLGITDVVVAGVMDATVDLGVDRDWVLVDKSFARDVGANRFGPSTLLVETDAGADIAGVADGVRAELPGVRVDDAAAVLGVVQAAPSSVALRAVLAASALAGALLAALALFVASVSASTTRARTLGTLRTMGMSVRPALGLVAWEIVPATVVAALVGTGLGLVLPWLVLVSTDLGPFTAGATPAAPMYDSAQVALVVSGFVVIAALATTLAVVAARRTSPATTVKMGEE